MKINLQFKQAAALLMFGFIVDVPAQPTKDAPAAISAIKFEIAEWNFDQFGIDLSRREIETRVVENLSGWGFPLVSSGKNHSHALEAQLGKIAVRNTPTGFSFSSGDSDPRGTGFQKAKVLPISCRLSDSSTGKLLVERDSSFSAHVFSTDAGRAKIQEEIADQISTACFDLLDEIKLPDKHDKAEFQTISPAWVPSVRVETTRIKPLEETKPLVEEQTENGDEGSKQLIIHNQGSPLILKMGHDRQ